MKFFDKYYKYIVIGLLAANALFGLITMIHTAYLYHL